jgi:hypothetical protein
VSAVLWILLRMRADPRLAYLIGPGSEAFALLTAEQAAAEKKDVAEFRREFAAILSFQSVPAIGGSRCDDIPQHDFALLGEPEPVPQNTGFHDTLITGWEQCRVCGLRRHYMRDRAAGTQGTPQ